MSERAPWFVAVDWGTTSFRAWLLTSDGSVLAERLSADGMRDLARDGFGPVLASHLAALSAGGVPADLPVVMCGMVGARQGWREAPYLAVPADAERLAAAAIRVEDGNLDRAVFILPGLAVRDEAAPDVMRGEETQLLGLPASTLGETGRLVCMPGTHSKWVRVVDGTITGFRTVMTGELYEVLSRHSVLRHSVPAPGAESPADPHAFEAGVRTALGSPGAVPAALFSVRARDLLFGEAPASLAARLSGLLIGAEIAGELARAEGPVDLVAAGALATLYGRALALAGRPVRLHDAEVLSRSGLVRAARSLLAP